MNPVCGTHAVYSNIAFHLHPTTKNVFHHVNGLQGKPLKLLDYIRRTGLKSAGKLVSRVTD